MTLSITMSVAAARGMRMRSSHVTSGFSVYAIRIPRSSETTNTCAHSSANTVAMAARIDSARPRASTGMRMRATVATAASSGTAGCASEGTSSGFIGGVLVGPAQTGLFASLEVEAARAEEPEQADEDEINRDDVIQHARHDKDEDAGQKRNQRGEAQGQVHYKRPITARTITMTSTAPSIPLGP